jgi:hypothetical protein
MQKHRGLNSIKTLIRPGEGFQRFKIVLGPDAYYMDIDLILGFTRTPIPYLGEDRRTLSAIPHSFSLDKKWPVENNQMAFALTAGFAAESKRNIPARSPAGRDKNDFQFILRPNIEFWG